MKPSRTFFAMFLVVFSGLLIWIASEPRYLPNKESRAIWVNRRENPQAWEREKLRLREPRLITNNIIMGLFALDGLGLVAFCHGIWRERRAAEKASQNAPSGPQSSTLGRDRPPSPQ
jgi:hypothetical protein